MTYLVEPPHVPGWRPLNPSGFGQSSVFQTAEDNQAQGSQQLTSFLASCSALLWLAMDIHWTSHQKSPDTLVSWQVFTGSKPKSNTAKQQAVDEVSELNLCERCYSLYIQRFLFIFHPSPGHAFRDRRLAWLLWWSTKTNLLSPKVSNESTAQPLANTPNETYYFMLQEILKAVEWVRAEVALWIEEKKAHLESFLISKASESKIT